MICSSKCLKKSLNKLQNCKLHNIIQWQEDYRRHFLKQQTTETLTKSVKLDQVLHYTRNIPHRHETLHMTSLWNKIH